MPPKRALQAAAAKARPQPAAKARPALRAPDRKGDRRQERRRAVKALEEAARPAGLEPLPRDPCASDVRLFAAQARERMAGTPAAADIDACWERLLSSGAGRERGSAAETASEAGVSAAPRLCETGVEGDLRLRQAGQGYHIRSHAFMLTFNNAAFVEADWPSFQAWAAGKQRTLKARAWAACMETPREGHEPPQEHVACETDASAQSPRVHLHAFFYWTSKDGFRGNSREMLSFRGVPPRVDVCSEHRGPTHFRQAALHGLWYVSVGKLGTLHADTNYKAWRDYLPQSAWLRSLWNWKKLSHERYLELSVQFRSGHVSRKREAEEVMRDEAERREEKEKIAARGLVYRELAPVEDMTEAEKAHKEQFTRQSVRYKALVYDRPSGTGKSIRAAQMYGAEHAFIVDCQNAAVPDLRGLSREKHSCLVLDEVPSVDFALNNKRLLMSHIDGAKLGQSATQMYSYNVWWWRKPIVITSNKWACTYEKASPEDRDWLDKNVLCQRLDAPVS